MKIRKMKKAVHVKESDHLWYVLNKKKKMKGFSWRYTQWSSLGGRVIRDFYFLLFDLLYFIHFLESILPS